MPNTQSTRTYWVQLILTLLLIAAVTGFVPLEKSLGANLRLVLLHGAWVWAGMLSFFAASAAGILALITRRKTLHRWSLALGRTGLTFWLTYLPMSLLVMQLNWGGFYFDEPRWKIPLAFGVAGLLLQAGLALFDLPVLSSAANVIYGIALGISMSGLQNILHPENPVFNSDSQGIQLFFGLLLALTIWAALLIARGWWQIDRSQHAPTA